MKKINLSFAGCGFLGIYHVGVVSCFKQYTPFLVDKILGASAGAISACCLLCDCELGQLTSDALEIATTANGLPLGPFNPRFNVNEILITRLGQILPNDAHVRCNNRLYISCTRVGDGANVILKEFSSKQEVIQALLCSSFIPGFSGMVAPEFRHQRYMDGCYSDNQPIIDSTTVTVSPFCGECDICPKDNSYNMAQVNLANTSIELSPQNLYRALRILFPPNAEVLSEMCKQGFTDALRYLRRNNLVSCEKCIEMKSAAANSSKLTDGDSDDVTSSHITIEESTDMDEYIECEDCLKKKENALLDDLPDVVLKVLDEACKAMNCGVTNWIMNNKAMHVISVLTLPYVVPFDFAYTMFRKFLRLAPRFSSRLTRLAEGIIAYLRKMLLEYYNSHRPRVLAAKFTCEVEVDARDDFKTLPNANHFSGQQTAVSMATRKTSMETTTMHAMSGYVNFDFSLNIESNSEEPLNTTRIPATVMDLMSMLPINGHDTIDQVQNVTHMHDALIIWFHLSNHGQLQPTDEKVSSQQEGCHHYTVEQEEENEDGLSSQKAHDIMDIEITAADVTNCRQSSLGMGDDDGYLLDRVIVVPEGRLLQPAPCLVAE